MKIKEDNNKRKSRYDRIIVNKKIKVLKVDIIGNNPIHKYGQMNISGKNEKGEKKNTTTYLFPSDHFGLCAKIGI